MIPGRSPAGTSGSTHSPSHLPRRDLPRRWSSRSSNTGEGGGGDGRPKKGGRKGLGGGGVARGGRTVLVAAGLTIEELTPAAVLARQPEITTIWPEASRDRVHEILPQHSERDGFRFLGAFDEARLLLGFVYGYRGETGQWWHDRVAAALGL